MEQRQSRMRLNREPAIRRSDEAAARNPNKLRRKLPLLERSAHVFDNRVRVDDIELIIRKRE